MHAMLFTIFVQHCSIRRDTQFYIGGDTMLSFHIMREEVP
jgi:hypothetical protein